MEHGYHKSFAKWCRKNDSEIKNRIKRVTDMIDESEKKIQFEVMNMINRKIGDVNDNITGILINLEDNKD